MSPIDKLPNELILAIFYHHTYSNHDTPQRLIRVNKLWNALAMSEPILWSNILVWDDFTRFDYAADRFLGRGMEEWKDLESKIVCEEVSSLYQTIERTKSCKFSLTVILVARYRVGLNLAAAAQVISPTIPFAHRCRALKLVYGGSVWIIPWLDDLSALEELEMINHLDEQEELNASLLKLVDRTSRHLRRLWITFSISAVSYDAILTIVPRVTDLWLTFHSVEEVPPILKAAKNVKQLKLQSTRLYWMMPFTLPPACECPSNSLTHLTLEGIPLQLLSRNIFTGLTQLSLRANSEYATYYFTDPLELPNVSQLTIKGYWSIICHVQAPRLQFLSLRDMDRITSINYEFLMNTTLRPTKLDLDVVPEEKMCYLIKNVWDNVEELQLVYGKDKTPLGDTLASAFMAKAGDERLCPNLRRLVILAQLPWNSVETYRIPFEDSLKEMAEGRNIDAEFGWCLYAREDTRDGMIERRNV